MKMLEKEGIVFNSQRKIDLTTFAWNP
jgi:alkylated DNA nucleotide flippase Atl1